MGRASRVGLFALGLFAATPAWAYIPTLTQRGAPVTWRGDRIKLNLAGNPINQSGIDEDEFFSAVVHGLQRWESASAGRLTFDYWQGTNPAAYPPASDYDGLSSVYFASNAARDPHLSPNVLGLTQVWYDTSSGQILEADIVLNDKSFRFTTNPQDTSGYGSGGPSSGMRSGRANVFIENVITHELGHAFGLAHSAGLQSTMLFMESPEQAHLGCDEQVAIHALYPAADWGARGGITGSVVSDSGKPVFGAHVLAISRRRGTVLATALTNSAGRYQIAALEPGAYFLMAEPYYAGAPALPQYYSGINSRICDDGAEFARTFLVDAGGSVPRVVPVSAGSNSEAPMLAAHCSSDEGADVGRANSGASSSAAAPEIYKGSGTGFGVVQKLASPGPVYYKLSALGGRLEAHALSYSLYSSERASLGLVDIDGKAVDSARVIEEIYEGDSGYINYDSAVMADHLPPGNYYLRVQPAPMDPTFYPAGTVALDTSAFVLVTGSVNEPAPPLAHVLPENARCRMEENFQSYTSPPGDPPRAALEGGAGGGIGFCGTVASSDDGKKGPPSTPSAGAVAGWLLPWVMMLAIAQVAKLAAHASPNL